MSLLKKMTDSQTKTLIRWFKNRIRKDRFSGLPLSVLFLIFGYISFHLAGLTEDVITSDSIVYLDHVLASVLDIMRNHQLVEFFLTFTFLGQPLLAAWGIILSLVGLLWTRLTIWLVPFSISVFTSLSLVYLGKNIIARPRPEDPLFPVNSYSFPSGHSTIAVSFYGFLGLIFILESRRLAAKLVILTLTLFLIISILLSRMFLGMHYLSDVIGGLMVGTLSIILGMGVYFWLKQHSTTNTLRNENNLTRKTLFLMALFLLAWIAFEIFGESTLYQDQLSK